MPLIYTPRQCQGRADFYHQLGQLLAAGVTLVAGLEMLERSAPLRTDRPSLRRVLGTLKAGGTFSEALVGTGTWLPRFDIALLHAGEQSGRLPECLRLLSNHYTEQARLIRQTLTDLAYPLVLLHLAVFLFPFAQFFVSGNLAAYLGKTVGVLAPFYLLALGLIYAFQGRRSETWRAGVEQLLHPVPLLGTGRRALALARLASALEALLSAGVTIIEAWEIAALACGSPAICAAVARWEPRLRAGQTPAEAVRESGVFPEVFANLYQTGEVSGTLDDSLRSLSRYYQEEGSRKLHLVAQWAPRAFYLVIVLLIAFKIVSFWMGYFNQVGDVINSVR
jgi:type II secretory pathway component PulF